jgi:hypothetical protein
MLTGASSCQHDVLACLHATVVFTGLILSTGIIGELACPQDNACLQALFASLQDDSMLTGHTSLLTASISMSTRTDWQ